MRTVVLIAVFALLVAGCGPASTSNEPEPSTSPSSSSTEATVPDAEKSFTPPPSPSTSSPAPSDPSDATEAAALLRCEETEPLEPGPTDEPPPASVVSCLLENKTFTVATYSDSNEVNQVLNQLDELMNTLAIPAVVGSGNNWVIFELPDINLPPVMQERVEASGGVLTQVGP